MGIWGPPQEKATRRFDVGIGHSPESRTNIARIENSSVLTAKSGAGRRG